MKRVIQIILFAAVIALTYMLWESIAAPIRFIEEKDKRYDKVIVRLKEIRTIERAYKSVYGKYTGSWDSLLNFVKYDSLPIVKAVGSVPDSLTLEQAIKLKIVSRDTTKVSVKDTLFPNRPNIDSIKIIPFTKDKVFELGAKIISTGSGVKVPVFEAKASNYDVLNGLDKQEIINLNAAASRLSRYKGLKVGSLEEATNDAGNWE